MGNVLAVCISERKGTRKTVVPEISVRVGYGIDGDAHAGSWHRQISLLAQESVDTMRADGLELDAGIFAENIRTEGVDWKRLPVGTVFSIGGAVLELTQIGKECHNDCEIKRLTGRCVMPTEGVFAVVRRGGVIRPGDGITCLEETK
ncbi:MAG: MOSC domain-containing protein [Butyricicoccus sp.]